LRLASIYYGFLLVLGNRGDLTRKLEKNEEHYYIQCWREFGVCVCVCERQRRVMAGRDDDKVPIKGSLEQAPEKIDFNSF
jgi:hypothetical protein